MRHVLLALLVAALTAAETLVSTWESRADRQVGPPGTDHFARKAAIWAAVFEALLYAGMYLVVAEDVWLAIPGVIAAGISKHWAMKRRIKKWKPRKRTSRNAKRAAAASLPDSKPSLTSGNSPSLTGSSANATPGPNPVTP